jgi:predicted ester cyclase
MTREEILGVVGSWARAVAACDVGALEGLVAEPLREAVVARTRAIHAAFEGVEVVAGDVVVEGDAAAWRWRLSGLHVGALAGVAPTRTRKTLEGANFQRLRGGIVVDHWTIVDLAALARG